MAVRPTFQESATTYTFPIALPIWTGKNWSLVGDLCVAAADSIGGTITFIIHKGFRSYIKLELHTTVSDQDDGKVKTEDITINLDRLVNVSEQRAFSATASSSAITPELLKRIGQAAIESGAVVDILSFKLNGHVWASNLFSAPKHDNDNHLLNALRHKIASSARIGLFASGEALRKVWSEYIAASEQQVKEDPFADFSPGQDSQKYEVGKAYSLTSMILAKDRPKLITEALISFPSMRIYFIHNTTALIQESEAVSGTEEVFKGASLTFIKHQFQRFSGFVELAQGKSDLKAGQKVRLKFQETGWPFACVVKPARATASARPTGYIVRMVRSDFEDARDDDNFGLPQQADDPKVKHLVDLTLDYLDVDTRRQLDGIVTIERHPDVYSAAQALLLANDLRSIPQMDFYDRLPGDAAEKDAFLASFLECLPLAFNKKQKEAFLALQRVPYAHMIQGPGGTGKSEFATLACQPLLLTSPPAGPKNQVLIVCGSNINVDDLAEQALEHSRRFLIALREPVVVRLHAYDTEIAVFTDNAAWQRALSADKTKVEPEVLAELKKRGIWNIEEQLAEPCEDHRLQLKHQSLGCYMKRVIGVGPLGADDPLYVFDRFLLLRKTYRSWANPEFALPSKEIMEGRLLELFDYVLKSADIVVTTTSNAAIPQLRSSSFKPCAIIVDEAGRLTEGAVWPILAFYGQVPTIFLGDCCQTGPFATAREDKNGFCKQLRLPFFGRLLDAGAASTTFVRQHRFPSAVCDFLSSHFYRDELESAPSVDDHPLIPMLKQFNKTHWDRDELMIYVDMPHSICQRYGENKTSRLNVLQLALVLEKVEALLASGISGASIGIASPYSCMNQFVEAGRDWLALEHPEEAPNITVATIDGFTGLEVDIMFIPLVVGGNIGFLKETSRICTALTRCRVGFVLIGNTNDMRSGAGNKVGWDNSALKKVILDLGERGMSITSSMKVAPTGMKDFLPDKKDLHPLDSRECYRCERVGHIARYCPDKPERYSYDDWF